MGNEASQAVNVVGASFNSASASGGGGASVRRRHRYYPKEVRQQRATYQFYRSLSTEPSADGLPAPKKPRVGSLSIQSLPPLPCTSAAAQCSQWALCHATTLDPPTPPTGPITAAVVDQRLTAKFRSISSWLLAASRKTSSKESSPFRQASTTKSCYSLPAGLLHRWGRKRKADDCMSSGRGSNASLNSLQDGRTPWPIPWIDAIFLPEYPVRGPVNEKHFHVIGTIASGAFGKVHRACLRTDPARVFAMKVQRKSDIITKQAVQQIKDEVSIHESLSQYPFVASFYASWQSKSQLYTVLQYVLGYGDLYDVWRDHAPFTEAAVRLYAAEIALALDYIHSRGIIYRDLKMENIVLDPNGHMQLVDFGLAKWLAESDRATTICGTLQYMAPEVSSGRPYGHAADWWSVGALLHALLCGRLPVANAADHYSLQYAPLDLPPRLSSAARLLLSRLLTKDAHLRLSNLDRIKLEPFFHDFDIESVISMTMHPFDYIPSMHSTHCESLPVEELYGEGGDTSAFDEDYDDYANFDLTVGW